MDRKIALLMAAAPAYARLCSSSNPKRLKIAAKTALERAAYLLEALDELSEELPAPDEKQAEIESGEDEAEG